MLSSVAKSYVSGREGEKESEKGKKRGCVKGEGGSLFQFDNPGQERQSQCSWSAMANQSHLDGNVGGASSHSMCPNSNGIFEVVSSPESA